MPLLQQPLTQIQNNYDPIINLHPFQWLSYKCFYHSPPRCSHSIVKPLLKAGFTKAFPTDCRCLDQDCRLAPGCDMKATANRLLNGSLMNACNMGLIGFLLCCNKFVMKSGVILISLVIHIFLRLEFNLIVFWETCSWDTGRLMRISMEGWIKFNYRGLKVVLACKKLSMGAILFCEYINGILKIQKSML